MNIDVPAGVGASPTANDLSSIRCCGYYFFHCLLFCAATIRGRLLFKGGYYSRVVCRTYHRHLDKVCMYVRVRVRHLSMQNKLSL